MERPTESNIAALRTRLLIFAIMAVIALGAIWLIDRRAMSRMNTHSQQQQPAATAPTPNASETSTTSP